MSHAFEWYIMRGRDQYGPFDQSAFEAFERERKIRPDDFVWRTGLKDWVPYREYAGTTSAAQPTDGRHSSSVGAASALLRTAVRAPLALVKAGLSVVTEPTSFGREQIDRRPRDLRRALTFYANVFAVVFLSYSALSQLYGFAGASEARELIGLCVQLALALPILYLLNLVSRQPVRFSGVVQAALYADGLFLIASFAVNALITYATPLPAMGRGELDIFATEYEKCLVAQSSLYWFIRGDLQFFMQPVVTPLTVAVDAIKPYSNYVVALPFCVIFAKLLNGRYAANALYNTIFAVITFIAVVSGWDFSKSMATNYIVNRSTCDSTFLQHASKRYSPELLGQQLAYRISSQISYAAKVYMPSIRFTDRRLLMDFALRPDVNAPPEIKDIVRGGALSFYCANDTDFRYARQLGILMRLIFRKSDGAVMFEEQLGPNHCPQR